jgi:hypothetical protein
MEEYSISVTDGSWMYILLALVIIAVAVGAFILLNKGKAMKD